MASVNKVILIGNLTRDPELRYSPKGTAVTELGLALNRRFRSGDSDWQEETTFVDVTVWGNQAETAHKYLSKGRQIYVEGRLRLDTWEDKTSGQKRSKLRVVAETIQFLGSRPEGAEGRSSSYGRGPGAAAAPASEGGERRVEDSDDYPPASEEDDIPF
ncbi:MAG TPA: single-stranded DNA-binding protein [Verrucomicrobiales bacterium]|nr:single-stranded DNA-binding protein [Verrucomicrobiales bacterium]